MRNFRSKLFNEGLIAIAFLAKAINKLNNIHNKGYITLSVFIINFLFSAFLSLFPSFIISIIIIIVFRDNSFIIEFKTYYVIFLTLFSALIFFNINQKINIPKVLLRLLFCLRVKYKSILKIYILNFGILVFIGNILFENFLTMLQRYGVKEDMSPIVSIILAIGITVASFYGFPKNKDDRDINELILTPLFLIFTLIISYLVSKKNMLSNFSDGNKEMSTYILAMFMLTGISHIITYFKKLFEKIHDIPKNSRRIDLYASLAERKFIYRKIQMKKYLAILKLKANNIVKFMKNPNIQKKHFGLFSFVAIFFSIIFYILHSFELWLDGFKIPSYLLQGLYRFIIIVIFLYIIIRITLLILYKPKKTIKEKFFVIESVYMLLFFISAFLLVINSFYSILLKTSFILFGVASIFFIICEVAKWLIGIKNNNDKGYF
ncbi:hypothetical protein MOE50_08895 [Bacillus inaquosorum]|uniref:hypothetical protein n=1 Tax=Bacillus inaquosorum TaxID=483913 RepID=UPI00227F0351|nr:hypothetical protein [Bacillus inaquosorum]MCY9009113.1 hypothetical protein [Bacillus inaquosorum]MCY9037319.1 hypothetical protein [Bacillus inaquosorum]MCY9046351.1 hypothetical protein [Bacillus inaquosorum]WIW29302.1 hypothetical protein QMC72_06255 [Bacillus inaquosorum]